MKMEKFLDKRLNRQKTVFNMWDPGLDPGPGKNGRSPKMGQILLNM